MIKIKLLVFLFFFSIKGFSQVPSVQWQKTFGGSGNDYTTSMKQTSDGGYIVAGYTNSTNGDVTGNHGGYDYWVIKLNSTGSLEWQKTYGGSGDDYAYSIQQTSDGGYIVAGYTKSNDGDVTNFHGGDGDFWVLKLLSDGTIQWQKTYGGTREDNAYSIQQTNDGGYIVAGHSWSNDGDVLVNNGLADCWILKLDNSGGIQWQKSIGGTIYETIYSIKQTSDGGFIIGGVIDTNPGSSSYSGHNGLIIKIDVLGNVMWQKSIGGTNTDDICSAQETSDGGYIIASYSSSTDGDVTGNHGGYDYWIIKTDSSGNIIWQKTYGGTSTDVAFEIKPITGGYIILGFTESNNGDVTVNNGNRDCWIIKIDEIGNLIWQKTLGGTAIDSGRSIVVTSDGGYAIAGYSESINGDVTSNHGGGDYWIIKLAADLNNDVYKNKSYSIYPNPAKDVLNISFGSINKINIVDLSGKNILSNENSNFINVSSLQKGMYLIQMEIDDKIYDEKFIKE